MVQAAFPRGVQKAVEVFEPLGPTSGHGRARPAGDAEDDEPAVPSRD